MFQTSRILPATQFALRHLALSIACAVVVMAPEHIYQLAYSGYQTRFSAATLAILTILFGLTLSGPRGVFYFLAGFVVFLQLSQLLHFTYFGTLISPHSVVLLFTDYTEIFESIGGLLSKMFFPILLAGVELVLLLALHKRTTPWHGKLPYSWVPFTGLLMIMPYKAIKPESRAQEFYPNPRQYAVANTFFAASYFLGRDLPQRITGKGRAATNCQPYQVTSRGEPEADNIIVVMGESLSASHMSLFGYERDTTPKLLALAKNKELTSTIAYSAGILTKVSLPMFYNVQREPGNIGHMIKMESNLFRLAKSRGFSTHYISVQPSNLATYVGEQFIDTFRAKEDMVDAVTNRKDMLLVDYLNKVDFAKRNFIVLHQRSSHGPYDHTYTPEFERFSPDRSDYKTYMNNTYDNAVLFTDSVVAGIIQHLKKHSRSRTLLVFTADHGELLGENGKYGHGHLQLDSTRVPFITYGQNLDKGTRQRLAAVSQPTHYEIGKQVATALGYQISNPNEVEGMFFVNGQDISGSSGYLILDKNVSPPVTTAVGDVSAENSTCALASKSSAGAIGALKK